MASWSFHVVIGIRIPTVDRIVEWRYPVFIVQWHTSPFQVARNRVSVAICLNGVARSGIVVVTSLSVQIHHGFKGLVAEISSDKIGFVFCNNRIRALIRIILRLY